MKEVTVIKWECDFCGKKFDQKKDCDQHEKLWHLCPKCKHVFYLYGSERLCTSKSGCHFEEKSNNK